MAQPIRRSQTITTYGPGAILEGLDGPRIIPTIERSGIFNGRRPTDFEIPDQRLSQALLNGAGILRLPSNAELGQPDYQHIYDTDRFPSWSLCVRHGILYRKSVDNDQACPRCTPLANKYEAWLQAKREAIRFVRACPVGHLDDVDWVKIIPHRTASCNPTYLEWHGGGGALRYINIECPQCGEDVNLGYAYSREWPCSGRFPELGISRPGCDQESKIIQRGASNLHISELQTALTIPPRSSRLHRLLEMSIIRSVLVTTSVRHKKDLIDGLTQLVDNGLLLQSIVNEIQGCGEEEILSAVQDVLANTVPATSQSLRLQEFEALRNAASFGAPAHPSPTPGAPPLFEVFQQAVRILNRPSGIRLRITPVNRLRVVMVQTGYHRLDPINQVVDRMYDDGQRLWYPGVELFGEGIFVDLAPQSSPESSPSMPLTGRAASTWFDGWISPASFNQNIHPERRFELHPVFVWWHTLAHRLIYGLSVDSGYSSASVRERVYVDINEDTGDAMGGVLLYTAQPGGDGTLGGLIALVPEFERVMESALRTLDTCSNDPLCCEEAFGPGKYNGAACYSCCLISETSCEYRNMRLDRNLLLENEP